MLTYSFLFLKYINKATFVQKWLVELSLKELLFTFTVLFHFWVKTLLLYFNFYWSMNAFSRTFSNSIFKLFVYMQLKTYMIFLLQWRIRKSITIKTKSTLGKASQVSTIRQLFKDCRLYCVHWVIVMIYWHACI